MCASCCACLFANRLPTLAVRHSSVTELSAAFKGGVLARTPFTKHGLANKHLDLHIQEPHFHDCLAYLARVRRRFGEEVRAKAVATNRFIMARAFFPTRLPICFLKFSEILGSRMCNGVAQTTAACSPKTQKPQKTQEMDVLYIGPLTARERGRLPLRRPENHPTDPTRPEPNRPNLTQ